MPYSIKLMEKKPSPDSEPVVHFKDRIDAEDYATDRWGNPRQYRRLKWWHVKKEVVQIWKIVPLVILDA